MNLNNKGWGTKEMIFFCCGLFIALMVATYYISGLYASLDLREENHSYKNLEDRLETAASRYISDNDLEVNGTYKISYGTLKSEGYIDTLKDINKDLCGGYVIISQVEEVLNYDGYISCNDYVTDGY